MNTHIPPLKGVPLKKERVKNPTLNLWASVVEYSTQSTLRRGYLGCNAFGERANFFIPIFSRGIFFEPKFKFSAAPL